MTCQECGLDMTGQRRPVKHYWRGQEWLTCPAWSCQAVVEGEVPRGLKSAYQGRGRTVGTESQKANGWGRQAK